MTRRRPDTHFDDASLEYLASSLLCDDAPPPSVHRHWKEHHAAIGDGGSASVLRFPGRGARSQFAPAAAAAAAVVILAGGAWLTLPGGPGDAGGEVGDGASSSTVAQPGPAQPDIDLAALGPAAGKAMGERDLGGLRDPALAAACLAQHGESEGALLGAAPMAHGDGVGQLFVLSAGMHGRVTVLLTVNTCGTDPAPPVVHRTIGAPG
ncbi:hypothetical protein ACFWGD_10165 [Corynebacterium sp. NPDC060344]|uniref:hypothetical protein n=1 Tax=Corynebacterium sp. NPDC060344 TaxID=3347101 RepID=UPI00366390AF